MKINFGIIFSVQTDTDNESAQNKVPSVQRSRDKRSIHRASLHQISVSMSALFIGSIAGPGLRLEKMRFFCIMSFQA